jgi:hypothetical protein
MMTDRRCQGTGSLSLLPPDRRTCQLKARLKFRLRISRLNDENRWRVANQDSTAKSLVSSDVDID